MYVRPFGYVGVSSVDEALDRLAEYGDDAKVLAGGQSLLPLINLGLVSPTVLIDIQDIPELTGIRRRDGKVEIGATTLHSSVERNPIVGERQPLLAAAVRNVGSRQVRNRGTVGGSVVHADPAAELPCVFGVIEAEYVLTGRSGTRRVAAADFATGYLTTQLRQEELLTAIDVPDLASGWGWGFHEMSRRAGDFAVVGAAAVACCRDGLVEELRLGLAGAAGRPIRCVTFEAAARGESVEAIERMATAVDKDVSPTGDAFTSADYRRHLARTLASRAAVDACRRSLERATV